MKLRMLALALCATAAATSSIAKTATSKQQDACYKDVQKFCKDALPDEEKVAACMKGKRALVSAKCAAQWNASD